MTQFINNKYTKWYFNIIKNASERSQIKGYTEKHHIIPKCMDGDNSSKNLVILTAREHFLCHWLLTKMLEGKNKYRMIHAFWFMHINGEYKHTSSSYEITKRLHAREMSIKMKKIASTDEWRQRSSENGKRNKGRKFSDEVNARKSQPGKLNGMYGKTHSNEIKEYLATLPIIYLKGKTYEEIYGEERAEQIKKQRSEDLKNYIANNPDCRDGANNPNAKTFIITDADGIEYIVTGNLRQWCKERNISFGGLYGIYYNNRPTKRGPFVGWTITKL